MSSGHLETASLYLIHLFKWLQWQQIASYIIHY